MANLFARANPDGSLDGDRGAARQEGTTNTVRVRTYGGMNELGEPDPTVPNDRPFHVTVTC